MMFLHFLKMIYVMKRAWPNVPRHLHVDHRLECDRQLTALCFQT